MKAQLLWTVLLLCVMSASASAQDRSQSDKPAAPEHPLAKYFYLLEQSTISQQSFKVSNEDYQLNSVEQQVLNEGTWISYQKTDHTYESGNRVETIVYISPQMNGNWELDNRELYSYENDLLMSVTYQNILNGITENTERTLFNYQTIGGMIYPETTTYQAWDNSINDWENIERTIIVTENGVISGGSEEEWLIDSWVETDRFTLEEVNGDLIETTYVYDFDTEEWVNYEQTVYPDYTLTELYEQFSQFNNLPDDGTLLYLFALLPDFTLYEWMIDEETEIWTATQRLVTSPSSEFENGATAAFASVMEMNPGDPDEWMPLYQVLVGFNDEIQPVALSFYSSSDESETVELVKIFGEFYEYDSNDLLDVVEKYGSWEAGGFFKAASSTDPQVTGRALLTWDEVATSIDPEEQALSFKLNAAYPNPFNPSTVIPYQLATASNVTIQVFDMLGRNVATLIDEFRPAGNHTVRFEGSGLASGVYMIRFTTADIQQTRSVSLIK